MFGGSRGIGPDMNTPLRLVTSSNNYFVVPGYRIIPPAIDPTAQIAETDGSEDAIAHQKSQRIVARAPFPIDWARYFFFDDTDPSSTLRAYDAARRVSSGIAAYRAPSCSGPWGDIKIIGDFSDQVVN
jgi:hypothetical protein